MKKVLFYFGNCCSSVSQGGTEVATYRIAKALKDSGEAIVFHAFHNEKVGNNTDSIYEDTIVLSKKPSALINQLSEFIRHHEIENVVVMGRFFKFDKIKKAVDKSGMKSSIYFMQHFAPGSEKKKTTYSSSWHLLRLNPFRLRYYFRALFYPLVKLPRTLRWSKVYRNTYKNSDRVILLSEGYEKDYCKVAHIEENSKFVAIPNIYESPADIEKKQIKKEKRVLIMSRMDEIQKRISLALKIWKEIEKDPSLSDWRLDIVGDGNNTDIVKRQLRKNGLERANMYGWQPRESFLERSSILMMTSEYEGLPLSILEAQAYGCVPVAYNSFASLKDVVSDEETGIIVDTFGDVRDYVNKLKRLMKDEELRKSLSERAKAGCNKFLPENIAEEWLKILT